MFLFTIIEPSQKRPYHLPMANERNEFEKGCVIVVRKLTIKNLMSNKNYIKVDVKMIRNHLKSHKVGFFKACSTVL